MKHSSDKLHSYYYGTIPIDQYSFYRFYVVTNCTDFVFYNIPFFTNSDSSIPFIYNSIILQRVYYKSNRVSFTSFFRDYTSFPVDINTPKSGDIYFTRVCYSKLNTFDCYIINSTCNYVKHYSYSYLNYIPKSEFIPDVSNVKDLYKFK